MAAHSRGTAGMKYSLFSLARNALTGHELAARLAQPRAETALRVVIVGGGGHGLATAYYLAKDHGITNVAVLEKGGSAAATPAATRRSCARTTCSRPTRTSTSTRSSCGKGCRGSQLQRDVQPARRASISRIRTRRRTPLPRGNAMRLNGIDAELLDRDEVQKMVPLLDYSTTRASRSSAAAAAARRHGAPRCGRLGLCARRRQPRRRHHPELRGHRLASSDGADRRRRDERAAPSRDEGRPRRGRPHRPCRGMAGLRLPIETHVLQAFVTEPMKPLLDTVVTFGAAHFYVSQSDKGELVMGGDLDGYSTRSAATCRDRARGQLRPGAVPELQPAAHAAQWGGVMDMTMDGARSSARRRSTASTSTAAGATAASRRRPAPAGLRRHDRERASRTSSTPRSGSTASAAATDRREGRRPAPGAH